MLKRNRLLFLPLVLIAAPVIFFVWKSSGRVRPQHVVLITIDSLRADHLGSYGYRLDTSPNLDRLAQEGVLFTEAITQGSKTPVALPSLHTSTYMRTHGCYREGYKINSSLPTLAEILKNRNYSTGAVVACIKHIRGLERGFDFFLRAGENAEEVTGQAIGWLNGKKKKSFFLWLHYFDPHVPYTPPERYKSLFVGPAKPDQAAVSVCPGNYCRGGIPRDALLNGTADPAYYVSQYDGEIRFVDEQVGVLLEALKKRGLYDDSVIIVTADHGELLGEHDFYFQHTTLFDQILKVPLIIRYGGKAPAKVIGRQVELIDIAPTVLSLLGLPKGKQMQGRNLVPLLSNRDLSPRCAFSEGARPSSSFVLECVRNEEWKLIYREKEGLGMHYLVNHKSDPGESVNLAEKEAGVYNALRKKLEEWRRRIPLSQPELFDLTEKDKELLKKLGYLE